MINDADKLRAQGIEVDTVEDLLNRADTRPPSQRVDPPQRGESLPHDTRAGDTSDNPRVVLGGNNPPEELTPYELHKKAIDDLYQQAKDFLDGEPIANEQQAQEVGLLRDEIRAAEKAAEESRKEEVKPFDAAKKAVQDRYNPLIKDGVGRTSLAKKACNDALAPYLKKKDDEQRAAAALAREQAAKLAKEALDAAQAAAAAPDLQARETAEDMLDQAKRAMQNTRTLEKEKPQVMGGGRNIGLKSVWTAELVDPAAALAHYRVAQPAALKEWLKEQAAKDVRSGIHHEDGIPGFKIKEDRVPS